MVIPLSEPMLNGNESNYLVECVSSGFVSSVGPFVTTFEQKFASFVGASGAVAVSSGTAALHVALLVAGVGRGDEVWVSDLTFIGSVNPVLYCGATPVLVDADRSSWNVEPMQLLMALNERLAHGRPLPKALVITHMLGVPADLAGVAEFCRANGILLIEDAAESVGAYWQLGETDTLHTGLLGDIGCFSFNGNKIITTGGGGMIVARNEKHLELARHLSTQAKIPHSDYMHDVVGYNYRMTNTAAAIGLAQLEQLPVFLAKRKEVRMSYEKNLESVSFQACPPLAVANNWLTTVRFDSAEVRDGAREALRANRIDSRPVWTPMRLQRPLKGCDVIGSDNAVEVFATALSLPSSATLQEHMIQEISEIVNSVVRAGV